MALHFGKRDDQPKTLNTGIARNVTASPRAAAPAPRRPSRRPRPPPPPTWTWQPPAATSSASASSSTPEGGSKLTVGPNIKLKGVEITDCDTLVVEGLVEATMDSRVIQIAEQGEFKGSAEIDIAEIRGVFDGNLTVRQKLVIYATGKVTGKIRYGKVVIEEGGQLSGDIECSSSASAKYPASSSQRSMALAA
ncbi:polymer-forming cytoskeletal protein [Hydrogenophaga sp. UC242_53]|uniref:bactofilin family protein n=1 Tax=Hydrogenophaga sp. UC242_53 TaxID=3350170 RepID=UPI0036D3F91A